MALNHFAKVRWFRFILHHFRQISYQILGLRHLKAGSQGQRFSTELPVGEAFARVMDRICLLESHVNWRIHGLPPKLCNLRLEELAILNSKLDLQKALKTLSISLERKQECSALELFLSRVFLDNCGKSRSVLIVVSLNLAKNLEVLSKKATEMGIQINWILDTDDLFIGEYEPLFAQNAKCIKTNLLSYVQAQNQKIFSAVWLSDWLYRQSPLKALVTLQKIWEAQTDKGVIGSLKLIDCHPTLDPRMSRFSDMEICKLARPEVKFDVLSEHIEMR
jgi:hypothetical protein